MATCVSIFSFLAYFRNGGILLYGDAVAHINIARRVFDSKTPGPLQLGTVWLPLPHLLMIPFIASSKLWRSGAGGSIPSLAAYVFGVLGIFRLTRTLANVVRPEDNESQTGARQQEGMPDLAASVAPWVAAGIYGANPNLIYMQTTAMGEALYIAFFIWWSAHFSKVLRGVSKALTKCGMCLAAASLTRYDGWFLAAALVAGAVASPLLAKDAGNVAPRSLSPPPRMMLAKFVLLAAAAPALWLGYNAIVCHNALEFANGPYSAKAIEQKTATVNPAKGNLLAAGSYFLKAAELDGAEANWLGPVG